MVVVRGFGVQDLYEAGEVEMITLLYHPFMLSSFVGNVPDSSLNSFLRDESLILSAAASLSTQPSTNAMKHLHVRRLFQEDNVKDGGVGVSDSAMSMVRFIRDKAEGGDDCMALVVLMALLHLRVFMEKTFCKYMTAEEKQSSWIGAFGDSDFQACSSLVEEDLQSRLLHSLEPKRNTELQNVFKSTLAQQLRVFASVFPGRKEVLACTTNPWHPVNLLFATDYDVTCTVKDTSEILVTVAERNSSEAKSSLEESYWSLMKVHDNRIKDFLSLWEYGNVSVKLTPVSEKRSRFCELIPGMDLGLKPYLKDLDSPEKVLNAESYCEYENSNLRSILTYLGDLEKKINKDVMAAGLLKGVRREQVQQEVKRIPLLHRCSDFLEQLSAMNTPIHYISASWSRDLILGGLPKLPGLLFVHSNDLEYNSDGASTGTFRGVVENAFDKEAILHALRRLYNVYPEEQKRAVFLGDSTNDLLALLDADLGIVMGQNPVFREMLLRYNLQLLPLPVAAAQIRASVESGNPKSFRHSGLLFEASGWAEVEACLLNTSYESYY